MYGVVLQAVILGISARLANACLVSNYFCFALFERHVLIHASSVHTFGGVCKKHAVLMQQCAYAGT